MSRRQPSSITSNQAGRESITSRQIVRLPSNAMSLFPPYPLPIHDTAGVRPPFQSQFNQLYHRGITGQPHFSNSTASRLHSPYLRPWVGASTKDDERNALWHPKTTIGKLYIERQWPDNLQVSDKHWWGSVARTGCAQLTDRMFSREVTGQGMGMRMEAKVSLHEREEKRNFRGFRQAR